jgi:hypothetical protein
LSENISLQNWELLHNPKKTTITANKLYNIIRYYLTKERRSLNA